MEGKDVSFTQLLEFHLNATIQKEFNGKPKLTTELLREVRTTLQRKIDEVFSKNPKHKLDERTVVWLADQYFKLIKVGDDVRVVDLVIINEYKLEDLPYHDIELLKNLYARSKAPWADDLREDFSKRTVS